MAKRVKAFVRWRKRAKAAEAQVDALAEAFFSATGYTAADRALGLPEVKYGKMYKRLLQQKLPLLG